NPAIVRFETNRPLSGLDHERYTAPPDEMLDRPVDELARRLFAAGGVEAVHINGAVVTVTLAGGSRGDGLADVIRGLFLHYPPAAEDAGMNPPTDEADRTPEQVADTMDTPAAQAAEEPAAAEPAAPEVAEPADAATTEPGTEPATVDHPAPADAGGAAEDPAGETAAETDAAG